MPTIDDYLEQLHHGVWEVVISKEDVTDPLSDAWKRSPINVPTPGTIASYRNGQYHVHETKNEWRVHLDRYDPKIHPILHLIDDAPLFLMIFETMIMLFSEARGRSNTTERIIKDQLVFLKNGLFSGIFLLFLGSTFIISPEFDYYSIFQIILPLIVIIAGFVSMGRGMTWRPLYTADLKKIIIGGAILFVGLILSVFPIMIWNIILLSVLCIWMLSSALMLLNRVRKGKSAVLEGFYSRFVIAVISLFLAVGIFVIPDAILTLFMMISGVIIILVGCTLIGTTLKLKGRSYTCPEDTM
ncbi:hypothetical protein [Methanosphaerula subterraneus]|uniref:hypothetical protein n=1 Tax=Methanosphaerula subterraneus TaxID=3350244 RepID=UPI003F8743B4